MVARAASFILFVEEGREVHMKAPTIYIPQAADMVLPILSAIPLQILAYYTAKARNCEIDQPRNLAKSVTVE